MCSWRGTLEGSFLPLQTGEIYMFLNVYYSYLYIVWHHLSPPFSIIYKPPLTLIDESCRINFCLWAFLDILQQVWYTVYTHSLFHPYRNGFSWFSYFALFYNAIVGFVGAIIRILLSLLFGTLLLFRLDQNIMIRGFEFADWGEVTI